MVATDEAIMPMQNSGQAHPVRMCVRGWPSSSLTTSSTSRRHQVDCRFYHATAHEPAPHANMSELADCLSDRWKPLHTQRLASLPSTTAPNP